jgi:hypothetical protein
MRSSASLYGITLRYGAQYRTTQAPESASAHATTELEAFRTIQYKMGSFFSKHQVEVFTESHIEYVLFHMYPPAKPSTACQRPKP